MQKENPLTARVVVNRLWESLFGLGLVRSSEDFGSQGDLPSHPELLDWLASELQRQEWNMKSVLRTIVTSDTYRQQSSVSPELREADIDNVYLSSRSTHPFVGRTDSRSGSGGVRTPEPSHVR